MPRRVLTLGGALARQQHQQHQQRQHVASLSVLAAALVAVLVRGAAEQSLTMTLPLVKDPAGGNYSMWGSGIVSSGYIVAVASTDWDGANTPVLSGTLKTSYSMRGEAPFTGYARYGQVSLYDCGPDQADPLTGLYRCSAPVSISAVDGTIPDWQQNSYQAQFGASLAMIKTGQVLVVGVPCLGPFNATDGVHFGFKSMYQYESLLNGYADMSSQCRGALLIVSGASINALQQHAQQNTAGYYHLYNTADASGPLGLAGWYNASVLMGMSVAATSLNSTSFLVMTGVAGAIPSITYSQNLNYYSAVLLAQCSIDSVLLTFVCPDEPNIFYSANQFTFGSQLTFGPNLFGIGDHGNGLAVGAYPTVSLYQIGQCLDVGMNATCLPVQNITYYAYNSYSYMFEGWSFFADFSHSSTFVISTSFMAIGMPGYPSSSVEVGLVLLHTCTTTGCSASYTVLNSPLTSYNAFGNGLAVQGSILAVGTAPANIGLGSGQLRQGQIFLYDCTNITACVNITSFQTTNSSDPTPALGSCFVMQEDLKFVLAVDFGYNGGAGIGAMFQCGNDVGISQGYCPTPSATASFTQSRTASATPSPTASFTESATNSPTASFTASATASASLSATDSATFSATQSATESLSESATQSRSQSATASLTQSATGSLTESASASFTPSATASFTRSATGSLTESATASFTASATGSATESLTGSATASATGSATASATESVTGSFTESFTASATGSATDSRTQSATESSTQSATESFTASFSESASSTLSATGSASESATGRTTLSITWSATGSASESATYLATESATVSTGGSATESPTEWSTETATGSNTASATVTATPSAAPITAVAPMATQSPTAAPTIAPTVSGGGTASVGTSGALPVTTIIAVAVPVGVVLLVLLAVSSVLVLKKGAFTSAAVPSSLTKSFEMSVGEAFT